MSTLDRWERGDFATVEERRAYDKGVETGLYIAHARFWAAFSALSDEVIKHHPSNVEAVSERVEELIEQSRRARDVLSAAQRIKEIA